MNDARKILIVGGGTAGWLTAAYLARALGSAPNGPVAITVLESPEIGTVGVGEGTFPTIRETLRFLGISEATFLRETGATFKQGIRFRDWLFAPLAGQTHFYDHPFEPPLPVDMGSLAPYWLLKDAADRPAFASAVSIQAHVAEANRAPKDAREAEYDGPLPYAYHFNARLLAGLLARRAGELGVIHMSGNVSRVVLDDCGHIAHVESPEHGRLDAALFVDCSGFRAELIGRALGEPLNSLSHQLFTDRAIATRLPYADGDPLPSYTFATAHAAGWTWDIGLAENRGVGCVYSSAHMSEERAAEILRDYAGAYSQMEMRTIAFEPGFRRRQWIGNCVAVGLSAGFLEPLEATGVVMIEAAVAIIADLFSRVGPADLPAARFNALMQARFENIATFLKLHYCLSRRTEPFWRDNASRTTWPARLGELLESWRFRPPSRYDLALDTDPFAFFNYQYVLYGMVFGTDAMARVRHFDEAAVADRQFARVKALSRRATLDLPDHRDFIRGIVEAPRSD